MWHWLQKVFGIGKPTPGTSVSYGRDWILYVRDGRKMSISADSGVNDVTLFSETVGRWDDAPDTRIDEDERQQIIDDVKQQLEAIGVTVRVRPIG